MTSSDKLLVTRWNNMDFGHRRHTSKYCIGKHTPACRLVEDGDASSYSGEGNKTDGGKIRRTNESFLNNSS